jgi:hypothetical protein
MTLFGDEYLKITTLDRKWYEIVLWLEVRQVA